MNALTLTTSDLTMSSREIAELTDKRHDHVMRDIRVMLTELYGEGGIPKFGDTHINPQNGQSYPIFSLPKDLTLTLVAGYNVKLRKRIIDRWMELESAASNPPALNPANMSRLQLLEMAMAAEQERLAIAEENSKVKAELEQAAPKARGFDLIAAGEKSLTLREAAKLLDIKQNRLTDWLHQNGWVYRLNGRWVAYQQHIQSGRLIYKEARYTDDKTGSETYAPYCHITPKGLTKLAHEFGVNGMQEAA